MAKMAKAEIGRRNWYLHFSMNALFEISKEYGNMQTALEILEGEDEKAFEDARKIAVVLAREAELVRRHLGYAPSDIPDEESFPALMTPFDFAELRKGISEAISIGYTQSYEEDDDEETDLGLAEIRKKETAGN